MMLAVWNWRIGASPLIMLGMLKANLSAQELKTSQLTDAFSEIDKDDV
jgi:hypothetical protein